MRETKTLTRAKLAGAITAEFEVNRCEALDFIEEVLDEIARAMVNGESVKLTGFGTFTVRNKKSRIGRNPKTKEEAVISARKSISFRASSVMKKRVNGGK